MKKLIFSFVLWSLGPACMAQDAETMYLKAKRSYFYSKYIEAEETIEQAYYMIRNKYQGQEKSLISIIREQWEIDQVEILILRAKIQVEIDSVKAEGHFHEAKDFCQLKLGKRNDYYRSILRSMGLFYQSLKLFDKAEVYLQEGVENSKNLGEEHIEYGLSLCKLAQLCKRMGNYEKAIPLFLGAVENAKYYGGFDSTEYRVLITESLIETFIEAGQYEKVGKWKNYIRSIERLNTSQLAREAMDYFYSGKYQDAEIEINLALEMANSEKMAHSDIVEMLNKKILIQMSINVDKAILTCLYTVDYCEKKIKNDETCKGTKIYLATCYEMKGEFEEAISILNKIIKKEDKESQESTLFFLAYLYKEKGDNDKALSLFREVLKDHDVLEYKVADFPTILYDNFYLNSSLYLADLYKDMGNYEKALPLYLEILARYDHQGVGRLKFSSGNRISFDYLHCLDGLSKVYNKLNQMPDALNYRLKSINYIEKTVGVSHPVYEDYVRQLALLYYDMGQVKKTIDMILLASKSNGNYLANNILKLIEGGRDGSIGKSGFYLEILQSLLMSYPDSFLNKRDLCWENISFYKSLSLKSMNLFNIKLRQSNDSIIRRSLDQCTYFQDLVNREIIKPADQQHERLDEYKEKAKIFERKLLALSRDYEELKRGLFVKHTDIQNVLKAGDAAIEFTHFQFYRKGWVDTTFYAAYIIRPGQSQPQFVLLCPEIELLKILRVSNSDHSMINKNYIGRGFEGADNGSSSDNLYYLLWSKLEPFLTGVKVLYICPSGYISKVSFAAIKDTMGQYLGNQFQINYFLSLSDLMFRETFKSPTSFFLAGGIKYEYSPSNKKIIPGSKSIPKKEALITYLSSDKSYLPGTLTEVVALRDMIKSKGKQTVVLTGDSATETDIKLAFQKGFSVVHIATHGFYHPFQSMRTVTSKRNKSDSSFGDPMYRSGLLLSGASYTLENGINPYEIEDGVLYAKEISTMNLSQTELVILSACETGLGDLNGNEGVMGIQRALKMAGVNYQITTLWQIPDKETIEFMELFYSLLLHGNSIESAFNNAQNKLSLKYPENPYLWGAFVLYR